MKWMSDAPKNSSTRSLPIDEQSWVLLQKRDSAYLTKLFAEVNPYLFKILAAQRVPNDHAPDLVQAAWEIFFKQIEQFKGQSQIRVYIAGILLNKVREHRRFLKKNIFEEDSEKIYQQAFDSHGWWERPSEDPQKLVESQEALEFVEECLEGLSPQQRDAFVLRVVEQEKTEDICNILGTTVTHLGVLLFRAKDKLRKCLEGKVGLI